MSESDQDTWLNCPVAHCGERFHTYHDEHRMTTLCRHLKRVHPATFNNFARFFEGIAELVETDLQGDRDV